MKAADDYRHGDKFSLGSHRVTMQEIVAFASLYDPQPYHLSQEAGSHSFFKGIVARGWHTAAIWMSLYVRAMLEGARVEGSPGVDELRWHAPVRPDDVLVGEVEILDLVQSPFRKDLITVKNAGRLTREGEARPLMTLVLHSRFVRRDAAQAQHRDKETHTCKLYR